MTTHAQTELHRGGCLCQTHELRITGRCLVDDLGMPADTSFEDALQHPIVQALLSKRRTDTGSGKTVGPKAGENTLFRLAMGDDHRGATWFDANERVVWLCAYGWHRSGERDDAFQLFHQLIDDDEIYPTDDDYRRLFLDQQRRFVELVPQHAMAAREEAMGNLRTIIEAQLGHPLDRQVDARIVADVVGDIAEISVAFELTGLNQQEILLLVRSFAPEPCATRRRDDRGGVKDRSRRAVAAAW
jgi:hypothetical protein